MIDYNASFTPVVSLTLLADLGYRLARSCAGRDAGNSAVGVDVDEDGLALVIRLLSGVVDLGMNHTLANERVGNGTCKVDSSK